MEDEGRHERADTEKEINCGVLYLESSIVHSYIQALHSRPLCIIYYSYSKIPRGDSNAYSVLGSSRSTHYLWKQFPQRRR